MIIIACLSVIAAKQGETQIVIMGCALVGACLGFLIFNLHPAKIFMGDTGSLLLRWCNLYNGTLSQNAININNYCNYSSI